VCWDRPRSKCGDEGKFGELDGEGVARAGDYVYVVSSHRAPAEENISLRAIFGSLQARQFELLHRRTTAAVERTWRVADALLASEVKSAYGDKKGKGTNIEGIAIAGERVYLGCELQ